MRRRKFLEALLATGSTAWIANAAAAPLDAATLLQTPSTSSPAPSPEIKRVLIVFKCHFDAGFIDTQANVVHRYFNEFFPKAIATAEQLDRQKDSSTDHANYTWTTGSWLLYEYLEQASPDQRKKMEQAIADGLYEIIYEQGEDSIVAFGMIPKWIMDLTEQSVREKVVAEAAKQLGITSEELKPFVEEKLLA